MKFELDTNSKTVKLLEDATLGDIIGILEKVLGNEAKRYRIITHVVNYNPVFISRPYEIWQRQFWWQDHFTTCADGGFGGTSTGTFLLETTSDTVTVTNLANN